jgi:endonuclease YncB( thermonuclease family)
MAGVAVFGIILFAVVAAIDGSSDWHRYALIVGFIVFACAGSWGLSALTSITLQTFRRRSRGRASPKRPGPWESHGKVVPFRSRAERWGLPGVAILATAFIVGFGGFFLLYRPVARDGGGNRVNVFRGSAEIVQLGRKGATETADKSSPQRSAGGGYSLCWSVIQRSCVIDGDTIRYGGAKIRIADIDTPEISEPKCASEAALGHRAKERLLELLNEGPFDIVHSGGRDEDVYGRKLRVLRRDGRSLGMILVSEGLAKRWTGARRSWCA